MELPPAKRRRSSATRDRIEASLPTDDPRFTELRAALSQASVRGRNSPAARMLGEWALLGFLLTTGKIALSGAAAQLESAQADLQSVQSANAHVATALKEMDWG